MLKETQKHMKEEIGFASLTKEEVAEQVEVIIKELEEANQKGTRRDNVPSDTYRLLVILLASFRNVYNSMFKHVFFTTL